MYVCLVHLSGKTMGKTVLHALAKVSIAARFWAFVSMSTEPLHVSLKVYSFFMILTQVAFTLLQ